MYDMKGMLVQDGRDWLENRFEYSREQKRYERNKKIYNRKHLIL